MPSASTRSAASRPLLLVAAGVVALAVSPPVDRLADEQLAWHMAQHLALLGVAAPAAVLATMPGWRGASSTLRPSVAAGFAVLHVVIVSAWHLPAFFDAAERHVPIHVVEHLSFVLAGAALWWAAGLGRRGPSPFASIAVFVASLPGIALGAAMTLAPQTWYRAYPSLTDQQVAGALMWSVGGAITVLCGVLCTVRWLTAMEAAA